MQTDHVEAVHRALLEGALSAEDLSARRLSAFLGQTTGALYHHHGSLDGFLLAVSQLAYAELGRRLDAAFQARHDAGDVAQAFVEMGLDHPALYALMFERRFDWAALRKAGAFERELEATRVMTRIVEMLGQGGSTDPVMDARLLLSALHGLVSLASTGRANFGALDVPDREIAVALARELASRAVPGCVAPRPEETTTAKSRARRGR